MIGGRRGIELLYLAWGEWVWEAGCPEGVGLQMIGSEVGNVCWVKRGGV